MHGAPDTWLPLLEYAVKTGVSLSTVRRRIKNQQIEYKIKGGKYWVRCPEPLEPTSVELAQVQKELNLAREEIAELKTLIAFYENA